MSKNARGIALRACKLGRTICFPFATAESPKEMCFFFNSSVLAMEPAQVFRCQKSVQLRIENENATSSGIA
jgi:hypothetical protein